MRPTAERDDEADYEYDGSMLATISDLVFRHLPLSVQAITLPALSKASRQWAEEQRVQERALEEAESVDDSWGTIVYVPLWARSGNMSCTACQRSSGGAS